MPPTSPALAAAVSRASSNEDVLSLLAALGRAFIPSLPATPPGAWGEIRLNPGDPAPIFYLPTPSASVDRELLHAARTSLGGSAACLIAHRPQGIELRVAVEASPAVETTGPPGRQLDDRVVDAWAALAEPHPTPVALLLAYRSLQRRSVGRAFFRDVRAATTSISSAWLHGPDDPLDRHALAINLLCRLMFLHFVQARGWLNGDSSYLAHLLVDPDASSLFHSRLSPLFFSVLNTPPASRAPDPAFRGIPYLNGGLFERTPLELAFPSLDLPDAEVRSLARTLERYRFVESERATHTPALDPSTLGSVFESLMDPAERGQSGAFYTPPSLVDAVVDQALSAALGQPVATLLSSPPPPTLRRSLDALAILDPAMGSGAFLVGALYRLAAIRQHALHEPPSTALRNVVERNLYGVDISTTAVTIAGLRLWLAIASAKDATPSPLPNLAHRLRQGNALWGLTTRAGLQGLQLPPSHARALGKAATHFASAHGARKTQAAQHLSSLERSAAITLLSQAITRVDQDRRAILSTTLPDLLGHQRSLSPSDARSLSSLDSRRQQLSSLLARAERGDWSPSFDFYAHFAPVMARGGFDLVLGNPPWVRLSNVPPDERALLKSTYSWMSAPQSHSFGAQPDLSVAFVQRSLSLLRPHGALALVVPAKLFSANYAATLRSGLLASATPVQLMDLSESPLAHFAADVLPAVIVATRTPSKPSSILTVDNGLGRRTTTTVSLLSPPSSNTWCLLSPRGATALQTLLQHPPLSSLTTPRLGIKTGANSLFLNTPVSCAESTPVIRGRDISPLRASPSNQLLFAHDHTSGNVLPPDSVSQPLKDWLSPNAAKLSSRADANPADPPWTLFRVHPAALAHRVAWKDIGERLDAAYLPPLSQGGPLALNSTYYAPTPDAPSALRLACWLCSSPVRFVASALAERALGGYRRFRVTNVQQVPVVSSLLSPHPTLDRLASALSASPHDTSAWIELDRLVANLLQLDSTTLLGICEEWNFLSLGSAHRREALWNHARS